MSLNGFMLLDQLRADLSAANFTVDGLDALWGESAAAALHRGQRLPALRELDDTPLAILARLFVLGLPAVDVDTAFPTLGRTGAVELGLIDDAGAPLLDLRPYDFADASGAGSWWIASDLGELALGHAIPEDHVLGVGGASMTLSGLMAPLVGTTVLDLGTGCGIQALHASRHASHIVATDISPRALELTRFNAELNGIDSIEVRLGSLYEPVAGERFDQIVTNPPFVITPRGAGVPAYEYRDGGLVGDAIVESVITGAESRLTPGGIAQLLGNWEYRIGEDGLDRVRDWIRGTGLDAWVIEREVQDAALYAETWIRDAGTKPGTPEFDELYAAWIDDFVARGVDRVGFGYVLVRRPQYPGVPRLSRFERLGRALGSGLGNHIVTALGAFDWLNLRSDAELAGAAFTVAPDVTEERHYWPGDEHPTVITLRQGAGFGREQHAGTALAAVVGACDGELTLGQICDAVADILEVDAAALFAEVVLDVRELVFTGFLGVPKG